MAGLSAGVSEGLGELGIGLQTGNAFVNGAANGILSNTVTQGVEVATGLQRNFDWAGVAAAGIGGGVNAEVSNSSFGKSFGPMGDRFVNGMAGGIARAATRSVITGTDFGDNIIKTLPDTISATIGNAIADGIAQSNDPQINVDPSALNAPGYDNVTGGVPAAIADLPAPSANVPIDISSDIPGLVMAGGGGSGPSVTVEEGVSQAVQPQAALPSSLTLPAIGNGFDGQKAIFTPRYDAPYVLSDDLTSIGRFEEINNRAVWTIEPSMTSDLQSAEDGSMTGLFRAGLAPVNVGMGVYNILTGNGTAQDYLAVASVALPAVGNLGEVGAAGSIATESAGGINTAQGVLYNGITGPGPLGADVASTFRSGSYLQTVTSEDTLLYRVYGGKAGPLSSYWTATPPSGPLQATIDSALLPEWGNTAQMVSTIRVPAGTTIYEGAAAGQGGLVGGGSQVVIPKVNPRWLVP